VLDMLHTQHFLGPDYELLAAESVDMLMDSQLQEHLQCRYECSLYRALNVASTTY
jgi:hypothetical protein